MSDKYVLLLQNAPCSNAENPIEMILGKIEIVNEVTRMFGESSSPVNCERIESTSGKCLFCAVTVEADNPPDADAVSDSKMIIRITNLSKQEA